MGSKPPVFIVGSPRSGTSLLRNMLNRHPSLAICAETHFNHYVYKRRRAFGDLSDLKNRQRLVDEYLSVRRIRRLGLDLAGLREKLVREGTSYPALFAGVASLCRIGGKAALGREDAAALRLSPSFCVNGSPARRSFISA